MKPEEMVPSVELCQRLRELGMPQGTTYWIWWYDEIHSQAGTGNMAWQLMKGTGFKQFMDKELAAPSVAELGEMLPALIGEIKNGVIPMEKLLSAYKRPVPGNQWDIGYIAAMPDSRGTEAEARAKLLIWCAENGHVSWARKEAMK